jgi:hypothetical protein
MKSNLILRRTPSGGSAPFIVIEKDVYPRVKKFLAKDERDFHDNPARCVIPTSNLEQREPLVKGYDPYGYKTAFRAVIASLSGWHRIKRHVRPLYYANSEGLRLIALHGSPREAFKSL